MPTRSQVLIPIAIAAIIIGIAGMLTIPTDVKLESVEFPRGTIKLDDKILVVQIADTDSLRVRGLSWQNELPHNEGMLFVFDGSGTRAMWMMGMQFNLDIIWFDENANVNTGTIIIPPPRPIIDPNIPAINPSGINQSSSSMLYRY